jgi:hypothetical protein
MENNIKNVIYTRDSRANFVWVTGKHSCDKITSLLHFFMGFWHLQRPAHRKNTIIYTKSLLELSEKGFIHLHL